MNRKILFDCRGNFFAAFGQLNEFACNFFIMAGLGQSAEFIGLLPQIGGPLSH